MEENNNKHSDIDALLGNIFKQTDLRDLFDKRVHELGLSERDVRRMLKVEYRTINGIIDGTQQRGDISSFKKLAAFLNIPLDEFLEIHSSLIEKNSSGKNSIANKKKFIKDNFDLAVLRKAGFINNITDFEEIEKRLVKYFWLTSTKTLATKIDNPYSYDRKMLIEFFPQIKWFSTNEDLGLVNVIKS